MDRKITAPFDKKISQELKVGDYVYITGTIYTARDAAHKRMDEALKKGEKLPFDVENNVIYYMGPSRCQKPPSLTGLSVGASLSRKNDAMPTRTVTPPATEKKMI